MTTPIAPSAEMPVRSRKQQILIKPKTPSTQSIPTQLPQQVSVKTLSEQAQQPSPRFGMFGPHCTDEEANDLSYVRALLQRESPGKLAIDVIPKTTNPDVVKLIAERFQKAYGNIDHPAFHGNKSTMLHCLVYRGKPDLIQVLINLGADPYVEDREGKTAFDRIEKITAETPRATRELKQQIRHMLENPPPKLVRQPLFQWPANPLPSVATITGFVANTATHIYGALPSLPSFRFWRSQPTTDRQQSESASAQDTHVNFQASHSQQTEDEAQSRVQRQISLPVELQHPSIQQASLPLEPQTRDYGVQVSDIEKQQMEKEISVLRTKKEKLQQHLTESQQQWHTQEVDFFTQKAQLTQENRKLRQELKKINRDAEQSTRTLEAQIDAASHENQSLRQELQQKSKTAATRISSLEEEQRDLQRKLNETRETAQRHQQESEEARQRAEQSLQQLRTQQTESRRSQSQQQKQHEQTQQLERENQKLRKTLEETQASQTQTKEQLERENQQLRKTLEEAQSSQTQAREQLTQQLEAMQQENHILKTELAEVQRKHTESSEKAKTSQQEAQRLQADLERIRRNHQHSQRRLHQEKDQLNQQLQALGDQHLQTQQWYDWQLGNTQMQLGSTQMENQALYQANASFAQSHAWLSSQLAGTQQEAQSWQEYSNTLQTELEEARQPQRHPAMTEHIGRLMSEVSRLRVRNRHLQQRQQDAEAQETPELHRSQVDRIEQQERSQAKAKSMKRSQSFSL